MDKLELKDIAPYLPYRLKLYHLSHFKGNKIIEDWGLKNCSDYPVSEYCDGTTYGRTLQEIKPILRPMSDLTEEITHGGETFVPMEKLAQIAFERLDTFHIHSDIEIITAYKTDEKEAYRTLKYDADNKSFVVSVLDENLFRIRNLATKNQYDLFQKLCEWHIDFQGLIGRGVAINLHTIDNGK
ncbi:hypothetical protein FCL53_17010 [Elizabethkingia meningoseptica]|uniref:hypothetical protein n=1 Tax=Elizabethkingia meningoseptica TaxID=238 RepID=UPI001365B888|nr:hypothetical protein [Elizabethkingia meningoseptica]MVW93664.1 hypothetical protein [Elizabethkingia meningoseptica]